VFFETFFRKGFFVFGTGEGVVWGVGEGGVGQTRAKPGGCTSQI
jgi:hypothetical protein